MTMSEYHAVQAALKKSSDHLEELSTVETWYDSERREMAAIAQETLQLVQEFMQESTDGEFVVVGLLGSHIAAIIDSLQRFGDTSEANEVRQRLRENCL